MLIEREKLYKFPWSQSDNAGGWVEVTDDCDLTCPNCYRHRLEGHRPLDEVKQDIIDCHDLTNCDGMAIAGGEPLLYPEIVEVVDFIYSHKIKPVLLTNGYKLTRELAVELRKAGLYKILFHIDSDQNRPEWNGKTEIEMNELRQYYADLIWDVGKIHCGFHVTVTLSTLKFIPGIVEWGRKNIHKVQHISFIALRGLLVDGSLKYMVNGEIIDTNKFSVQIMDPKEIMISSEEMFNILIEKFPDSLPCAYLGGTSALNTYKFLIIINIGSKKNIHGNLGAKTIEMVQVFSHLFKGRYSSGPRNPKVGRKTFFLSAFDRNLRKAFIFFLKLSIKNPLRFFDKIYIQSINFQQPSEIVNGEINLCSGCYNMMMYKGKLINSCKLDEYRIFGDAVTPILSDNINK